MKAQSQMAELGSSLGKLPEVAKEILEAVEELANWPVERLLELHKDWPQQASVRASLKYHGPAGCLQQFTGASLAGRDSEPEGEPNL